PIKIVGHERLPSRREIRARGPSPVPHVYLPDWQSAFERGTHAAFQPVKIGTALDLAWRRLLQEQAHHDSQDQACQREIQHVLDAVAAGDAARDDRCDTAAENFTGSDDDTR